MADFENVSFFQDRAIQDDPNPYYDWLREQGPVWQEPRHGIFMVTGHREAVAIYSDPATFPENAPSSGTFSSCNTIAGPFFPFSVPVEGDDISDVIVNHRHELPFSDQLPSFDPPRHTDHRSLLKGLMTPKRLKENEEFMWQQSERQLDGFLDEGRCEWVSAYAEPFTLKVIADLEGVPESDFGLFQKNLSAMMPHEKGASGLEFLYDQFSEYIEDRRQNPRNDILTGLATATFPDGSLPSVHDAALIGANLFAGGQETTVRLLTWLLMYLGERPDLQKLVREDRDKIPNLVEEVLRLESPLRALFRMARVSANVFGVDVPAGSSLLLLPGAANRDPRMFENPNEFDIDRPNGRQHIAFAHGIHTCVGAPLARAESRVTLNRLLDRTTDITISEKEHGPPGGRRYEYVPLHLFRALQHLHVEFATR